MKLHRPTLFIFAGAFAAATLLAHAADDKREPWAAPARAAKKKNPVSAIEPSLARGREIWIKDCASCHGDQGRGDGPAVKDLEVKPGDLNDPHSVAHTDGDLFWKITEGRKPMPSFAENYSEEDRWNVINYLRKITAQPAPKS